jgi:hypothetical protein
MKRRALLALLGAGAATLAGCLSGTDDESDDTPSGTPTDNTDGSGGEQAEGTPQQNGEDELPDACPTSQDLDVEWPADLDESAVKSFVNDYEHAYYKQIVVGYEPTTQLDSYELDGQVTETSRVADGGWVLAYQGGGAIQRPTLLMGATTVDPPADADPVSVENIDDEKLSDTLTEAAETGEAELFVETPRSEIKRYVDLLASLSPSFEQLSDRGQSDTLYADADGTIVELSVSTSDFHGDYWWETEYYVDERVVRRTTGKETDPHNGELLECRTGD